MYNKEEIMKHEQLLQQTAQYAVEHVTGEGMHTGFGWVRDSFEELCEAVGAGDRDLSGDAAAVLKENPWVFEIANKSKENRTPEELKRVKKAYAHSYGYLLQEVSRADIEEFLKNANLFSQRHLLAQKVAVEGSQKLSVSQRYDLNVILDQLVNCQILNQHLKI